MSAWIREGEWTPAWLRRSGRRYLLARTPASKGGAWVDPAPWGDGARPAPPTVPRDVALAASKGPVLVLAARLPVIPTGRDGDRAPGLLDESLVVVRLPAGPAEVLAARRGTSRRHDAHIPATHHVDAEAELAEALAWPMTPAEVIAERRRGR